MDKCEEKVASELNLDGLLQKIRESNAMITNLASTEDLKPLLKFNKNNVVILTESDEYPEESDVRSSSYQDSSDQTQKQEPSLQESAEAPLSKVGEQIQGRTPQPDLYL